MNRRELSKVLQNPVHFDGFLLDVDIERRLSELEELMKKA